MKYLVAFIVLSFIGWLFELIVFNKRSYDVISHTLLNINVPLLPLYGISGVIVLLIDQLPISLIIKIIIAAIIVNLLECLTGLLSYQFHGYQTWKYDNYTVCHRYVSLYTGLCWTLLITIYYWVSNYL